MQPTRHVLGTARYGRVDGGVEKFLELVMKRIGWIGYVNDEPDWESVYDNYVETREDGVVAVNIFQYKKDALERYEDVRPVYVKD